MCQIQFIKPFTQLKNGEIKQTIIQKEDLKAFNDLMLSGSIHNNDSWGAFSNSGVVKSTEKYKNESFFEFKNSQFVVGHNRFATKGSANKSLNAHPFENDRFIWVHNGILSNDEALREEFRLTIKSKTDSAVIGALAEHFVTKGRPVQEALIETIELLEGDYSVIIFDKETEKVYYFRNDERTFFVQLLFNSHKNKYVMLGSSQSENFERLYTTSKLGFAFNDYEIIDEYEIPSKILFELGEAGIKYLETFDPVVFSSVYYQSQRYLHATSSNPEDDYGGEYVDEFNEKSHYDGTDKLSSLSWNEMDAFYSIVNKIDYEIELIPDIALNNDVCSVLISGEDKEKFRKMYSEYFPTYSSYEFDPESARDLFEALADDLKETIAAKVIEAELIKDAATTIETEVIKHTQQNN